MKIKRNFQGLNKFKPMKKLIKKNILNMLIVYSIIMILLTIYVGGQTKQSTQRPSNIQDIAVTLINQEPDPAEPGKYVDVRIKFDNNGTGEARDVDVEILPEYPLSLDPGRHAVRNIGILQSRQKGDVGVIVKYKLRVDKNAVEGENELRVRYRIDKGVWIKLEEFFVDIQTHDAILAVDSVSLDKKTLEPGSSGNIKIMLSNKADSVLKDIKVTLDIDKSLFVPLGSTNEKSIYQIDAKEDYEFNFKILANPEAESGVYQVPLKIAYSDELGKGYVTNGTIGIVIGAIPDLSVTLDDSDIYEAGKSGEIVIKVVNKGVINIKFVNMKLLSSEDYRILSNEDKYLGNIESDDFETAEFKLFVDKTRSKQITLPLVLEYKDANNNDFSDKIELKLNLYTASEAKKLGLKQGNRFMGALIIIVIVVAGLWYYRKRRKMRKKS
ncbi:MAG: hypothetical protein IH934_01370 [Nanoarchaeota archaeon]|nr:hypothetical protein [Nanoarchaeota archaeon]